MPARRPERLRPARGRARAALLFAALACAGACSVLLEGGAEQCAADADCARFPGSVCDVAQATCVRPGPGATSSGGGSAPSCEAAEKPVAELSGEVTKDFTLTCNRHYLLKGTVLVTPGATLTIEKGTTLLGDSDPLSPGILAIQPGAKLVAVGTPEEPIVFTSALPEGLRERGDWGGVILLGRAPANLRDAEGAPTRGRIEGLDRGGEYGGDDVDDSSGILKYVRIEYSGFAIAPNNEVNGLTFGGVGKGTIVDHVQVRHTADDCFEFFGGTVDAKYLACQHAGDDGFDWDNGFRGRLQFLVLQQEPSLADEMNGFEGDNDALGTTNSPVSEPTIYNATLCGKNREVDLEQYGILLRRGTRARIFNTVVTGFESGLDVRDAAGEIEIESSVFFGNLVHNLAYPEPAGSVQDDDEGFDEAAFLLDPARGNREVDPRIPDCFNAEGPELGPSSPLTEGAATPPDDGFFDATATYVGAFRDADDRWATTGAWAVWSRK
ncbi:hypothetical protein SOCEGT47_004210 [Sorangium cellulosum]|uniref:Lipoprotein n=1 Tax=Sorangium cellulosum TaxID=56 RepID=A0A4P2PTN3_SORCE|nr:hypothetical protein SOCEGT47_004210 [Sorangium cellulosum]